MNPYEVLGVKKDFTKAQLTSAYRSLSKVHHPDSGGDRVRFEEIKLAYDVLSDAGRRKRYDLLGRTDLSPVTAERVRLMIDTAVQTMIAQDDDPCWADVRSKMIGGIQDGRKQIQNNMATTQRKLERVERLIERFKSKNDHDPVGDSLRAAREKLQEELRGHQDAAELSDTAEQVFREYDYEVGPGPEGQFSPGPPLLRRGTVFLSSSSANG